MICGISKKKSKQVNPANTTNSNNQTPKKSKMDDQDQMEQLIKEFAHLDLTAPEPSNPEEKGKITGLVYHKDMLKHAMSLTDEAKALKHPENPKRLETIINRIQTSNLTKRLDVIEEFEEAEKEIVTLAHPEDFFDYINEIWFPAGRKECLKYFDTYYNPHSSRAAKLAVQSLKICVDKILGQPDEKESNHGSEKPWKNGFAAIRPPGHHAMKNNRVSGFCFFNNVGVGAEYAIKKYGLKRVVVFDWDVHHGDGSQRLFEGRKDVLFMSIHRFENGKIFPGPSGGLENVGINGAEGYNLNLPWNTDFDHDYRVNIQNLEFFKDKFGDYR